MPIAGLPAGTPVLLEQHARLRQLPLLKIDLPKPVGKKRMGIVQARLFEPRHGGSKFGDTSLSLANIDQTTALNGLDHRSVDWDRPQGEGCLTTLETSHGVT